MSAMRWDFFLVESCRVANLKLFIIKLVMRKVHFLVMVAVCAAITAEACVWMMVFRDMMMVFWVILLGCLMMIMTVISYVNWSWGDGDFNGVWLLVNDWHMNFFLVNNWFVNYNRVGNGNGLFDNIRNFLFVNNWLWNGNFHFIRDLPFNMNWIGSVDWNMTVEKNWVNF